MYETPRLPSEYRPRKRHKFTQIVTPVMSDLCTCGCSVLDSITNRYFTSSEWTKFKRAFDQELARRNRN